MDVREFIIVRDYPVAGESSIFKKVPETEQTYRDAFNHELTIDQLIADSYEHSFVHGTELKGLKDLLVYLESQGYF